MAADLHYNGEGYPTSDRPADTDQANSQDGLNEVNACLQRCGVNRKDRKAYLPDFGDEEGGHGDEAE